MPGVPAHIQHGMKGMFERGVITLLPGRTARAALCAIAAFAIACADDSILELMDREHKAHQEHGVPPLSFTDNEDGTITDNLTGLEWTKCSADGSNGIDDTPGCTGTHGKYLWDDALILCNDLSYAGYDDWRLPSFAELVSIIDYGSYNPAAKTNYFPNTHYKVESGINKAAYWSSSICYPTEPGWNVYSLMVEFMDGKYTIADNRAIGDSLYVRCVRDMPGLPNPDFIAEPPGVVHDNSTGLRWMRCSILENGQADPDPDCSGIKGKYAWNHAVTACENLSYAGRTDWRLPTIRELFGIVSYDEFPAIENDWFPDEGVGYDPDFIGSSHCWSYTSYAERPADYAWSFDFFWGGSWFQIKKTDKRFVRCVAGTD